MGICGTKQLKIQDSQPITHASLPVTQAKKVDVQQRMRQLDKRKALDVPVLAIKASKIYQRRKQHSESRLVLPADLSPKHSFAGV